VQAQRGLNLGARFADACSSCLDDILLGSVGDDDNFTYVDAHSIDHYGAVDHEDFRDTILHRYLVTQYNCEMANGYCGIPWVLSQISFRWAAAAVATE
jgi:hypothetical protein